MATLLLVSLVACNAQIKNTKTEVVKVYGNCGMCETKIEKAGNVSKVSKVDWNSDTKMATLTYDASKTNKDEILKRIALAGYDSDFFRAPNSVYENLHGCCQYDRIAADSKVDVIEAKSDPKSTLSDANVSVLTAVFENYFTLKEALVKTDGKTASTQAKELLLAINAVQMESLKVNEHVVWMKVVGDLKNTATAIAAAQDVAIQRSYFDVLSASIYQLIKVSKQNSPTYFQHCPMANDGKGANWLSKENTIKNPYFGSMMLSCGKTVEILN